MEKRYVCKNANPPALTSTTVPGCNVNIRLAVIRFLWGVCVLWSRYSGHQAMPQWAASEGISQYSILWLVSFTHDINEQLWGLREHPTMQEAQ